MILPSPAECQQALSALIALVEKHGLRSGLTDGQVFRELQETLRFARDVERRLYNALNGTGDGVWK